MQYLKLFNFVQTDEFLLIKNNVTKKLDLCIYIYMCVCVCVCVCVCKQDLTLNDPKLFHTVNATNQPTSLEFNTIEI